ncbi:hypothetical protein G7Y89_g2173 [Cudoniella acicularis]|uniref:Uncharacterized protein n=1 Tax=Cudoniella acicularis TaxID=354080 RepID=A0A8H4RUZ0_9HELO|nr:hypothetical protein G7Y89_g2173 [Cudoniella acicularis]
MTKNISKLGNLNVLGTQPRTKFQPRIHILTRNELTIDSERDDNNILCGVCRAINFRELLTPTMDGSFFTTENFIDLGSLEEITNKPGCNFCSLVLHAVCTTARAAHMELHNDYTYQLMEGAVPSLGLRKLSVLFSRPFHDGDRYWEISLRPQKATFRVGEMSMAWISKTLEYLELYKTLFVSRSYWEKDISYFAPTCLRKLRLNQPHSILEILKIKSIDCEALHDDGHVSGLVKLAGSLQFEFFLHSRTNILGSERGGGKASCSPENPIDGSTDKDDAKVRVGLPTPFDAKHYDWNKPWVLYNIMIIERKEDVVFRIGLGQIHISAFWTAGPVEKDIILGSSCVFVKQQPIIITPRREQNGEAHLTLNLLALVSRTLQAQPPPPRFCSPAPSIRKLLVTTRVRLR